MTKRITDKEFWTMDLRKDCSGREHLEVIARCATEKCARDKKFSPRGFQVEVKPIRASRKRKEKKS